MALKAATKRIVFNDESVNSYGFRVLNAGMNIEQYKKNPLLLFNHQRPQSTDKNQILPLGRCTDLKLEDGQWSCLPMFDDQDAFAMSIYNKYEDGTISMSSPGFLPTELSDMPDDMVDGQSWPTVTQCNLVEISLVDIGANKNACQLYDTQLNIVKLSAGGEPPFKTILKSNTHSMKELKAIIAMFALADTSTIEDVTAAIAKLQNENKEVVTLRSAVAAKDTEIADLKKAAKDKEILALVDAAVKDGKITSGEKDRYVKLAHADFETTKETLDAKPKYTPIAAQLSDNKTKEGAKLAKLSAMTYKELDRSGDLIWLKNNAPDVFEAKYEEHHGKPYNKK